MIPAHYIPAVTPLPIEAALPALRAALRDGTAAVLQAPPGAGKTTGVPLALLDEPWLRGGRIVMLEPRRLATRAAARRMASTLGEDVGRTVGYRMRLDSRVGPRTRIEVATEGVLTRMLRDDPGLEGVGLVIFDEFHERNLVADVGLALALETQAVLRPELRILVMSATLDGTAVAELLGGAPVVTSEGRTHPVTVHYRPPRAAGTDPAGRSAALTRTVVAAVREAIATAHGDILVFVPGGTEIAGAERALVEASLSPVVRVLPLHGSLPQAAQDAAIAPSPHGSRKVVLATSIAETSLTIEGVRIVIDAGLSRVPRFSPRTGMTRLETVRVSRASADQRCGRAGRLDAGVCFRLWAEHEQHQLRSHGTPEILEADLAPLALDLASTGVRDPRSLRWLDPPPPAAFAQARELLVALGALQPENAGGALTDHGREMAALGTHPRLAHLLLRGRELGHLALACDVAALLEERDPLRSADAPVDADIALRLSAVRDGGSRGVVTTRGLAVHGGTLRRVRDAAAQWRRRLGARGAPSRDLRAEEVAAAGLLLAFAYPDRIGQRRTGGDGRFLLRNGQGAAFAPGQPLGAAPYIVAAELDGRLPESRIFLAAALAPADLAHFVGDVMRERAVWWDADREAVLAVERERLGAIILRETTVRDVDPAERTEVLIAALERAGVAALPWTPRARSVRERVAFLRELDAAWPDLSDEALASTMRDWLAPHLHGVRTMDELRRLDLAALLLGMLSWAQRSALDELAPTHLVVPSGSRIPIDYGQPESPTLAVRLQEMFGLADTPRVGGGRVPLTLHLLSPAQRPMQVTRDLAGFWRTSYFDVRKEMKGRYPKHPWPDDPLAAPATRRVKPRRT